MEIVILALLALVAVFLFMILFGGFTRVISSLIVIVLGAYLIAGIVAISMDWFPPGWTEDYIDSDLELIEKSEIERDITGEETISNGDFDETLNNILDDILIIFNPQEVIETVNSSQNALMRFLVGFLGALVIRWLNLFNPPPPQYPTHYN